MNQAPVLRIAKQFSIWQQLTLLTEGVNVISENRWKYGDIPRRIYILSWYSENLIIQHLSCDMISLRYLCYNVIL